MTCFELTIVGPSIDTVGISTANEVRDVESVDEAIAVMTERLADLNVAHFNTTIAGIRWPTDTRFDLPTVLEQILTLTRSILGDVLGSAILDFYEQGIERRIRFDRNAGAVLVTEVCESSACCDIVTTSEFSQMLRELVDTFAILGRQFCPDYWKLDVVQNWHQSLLEAFRNQCDNE